MKSHVSVGTDTAFWVLTLHRPCSVWRRSKDFFHTTTILLGILICILKLGHPERLQELNFLWTQRSRKTQEGSGCWEDSNPRERFMNNKPLTGLLSGLGGLPERNWISKSGLDFSWLGERWYICFRKPLSLEVKGRAVPDFSKRIPSDPSCWQRLRGGCYSQLTVGQGQWRVFEVRAADRNLRHCIELGAPMFLGHRVWLEKFLVVWGLLEHIGLVCSDIMTWQLTMNHLNSCFE